MRLTARQKEILRYLAQTPGVLSSSLLSEKFDVSVQTIRKDMNELSDKGLVRRVHGGISFPSDNDNLSFSNREVIHLTAKQKIAQRIVEDLPQGISIFLGIGTTPKQVAHALLDHPGLTVVTNNIHASLIMSRNPQINVYLAGGAVRSSDEDTVGESVTRFYRQFNIKIAVFGVGGLSQKGELLDFTPEEADLTQAMMAQSQTCWLIADQSKYQRYAPVVSGKLDAVERFYSDQHHADIADLCFKHQVNYIIS
ncbi:DeoR/GlpR family DNA-binding transcription regulator [Vibrio aerogenes]|uniref:DeoR/GlpR family DNA-binding transcription regulator n=1 Tax=Vibrio aerogenes TaxID=92172 RepID=UPI0039F10D38